MFIHLDLVGGIAGDMFIAAVLDAWPNLTPKVFEAMQQVGLPSGWSVELISATSAGIMGKRLIVSGDADDSNFSTGTFMDIRSRLLESCLPKPIIKRAVDIFYRLAEAEGIVHGKPIDAVHFHEIADWDSVCDIVGAAVALEEINCSKWSVSNIPMGSGTVNTAHGLMPVPAPATSKLLEGFIMVDDGIPGERVTPTGAAILSHISASQHSKRGTGRIIVNGHGLGTREITGAPNMLRLIAFEEIFVSSTNHDEVGDITFEVDDQTGEDLAVALDILRDFEGVLDVVQYMVSGKKGRLANSVRILCDVKFIDDVIKETFLQTTTIGLRTTILKRRLLSRENVIIGNIGAKKSLRPDGLTTVKVNMDELKLKTNKYSERSQQRSLLEGGARDEKT